MHKNKSDFCFNILLLAIVLIMVILVLLCELPFLFREGKYDVSLLPEKAQKLKQTVDSSQSQPDENQVVQLVH